MDGPLFLAGVAFGALMQTGFGMAGVYFALGPFLEGKRRTLTASAITAVLFAVLILPQLSEPEIPGISPQKLLIIVAVYVLSLLFWTWRTLESDHRAETGKPS